MTLTDKTGTPVTVSRQPHEFTIAARGKTVGRTEFSERDGQRVFQHTEVDDAFGGRGLATVMITEALAATRADGLRIVAVCPMVAGYVKKHHDLDDIVDRPDPQILDSLQEYALYQAFSAALIFLTNSAPLTYCRFAPRRGTVIAG